MALLNLYTINGKLIFSHAINSFLILDLNFHLSLEANLPLVIFLKYIDEGEKNYNDAMDLAKFCNDSLNLFQNDKGKIVLGKFFLKI